MTTHKLPERADGGIDWDKISLYTPRFNCVIWPGSEWVPFIDFAKMAVAHERERCARRHDEEANWIYAAMSETSDRVEKIRLTKIATWHQESAAAIRKMEP